jgi:thiol-disulfide isomerase/thioredoxin
MKCAKVMMVAMLCAAITGAAHGQRKLSVGAKAPALSVDVVHGESVQLELGKVYVIEFWATWCGPCRAAIPHLSELQDRFGEDGLVILGVSDEAKDTVTSFVQQNRDRISYAIGVDQRGATKKAWFEAAKLEGIPATFIVDRELRIQYIGNPHSEDFPLTLGLVLTGHYDARMLKEAEPALAAIRNARKLRDWRMTFRHIDQLLETDKRVFAPLTLQRFEIMIADMGDAEQAYEYARTVIRNHADDPMLMSLLAEKIATDPKIPAEKRDLAVAQEAVDAAAGKVGKDHTRMLALQALVCFHRGEVDQAVRLQRQAWMKVHPSSKARYQRVLRTYQEAQTRASRMGGDRDVSQRTGGSDSP